MAHRVPTHAGNFLQFPEHAPCCQTGRLEHHALVATGTLCDEAQISLFLRLCLDFVQLSPWKQERGGKQQPASPADERRRVVVAFVRARAPLTSCLSNSFHEHRLPDAELHPQVGGAQLVQTQVDAAQQVIWKNKT